MTYVPGSPSTIPNLLGVGGTYATADLIASGNTELDPTEPEYVVIPLTAHGLPLHRARNIIFSHALKGPYTPDQALDLCAWICLMLNIDAKDLHARQNLIAEQAIMASYADEAATTEPDGNDGNGAP